MTVMTILIVENPDGQEVARVQEASKGHYKIETDDDETRKVIESVIDESSQEGIVHHYYRRRKTSTGLQYQQLGKWLKPGDNDYLQALGDYLIHYSLIGYPLESTIQ